ncbi:PAS domain-containing protein [Shewanella sp. D64]|uniref:helix-turn-helix transcriptional regulator n=1 Tax=unclassified Shewanella TaxID=196818 RepID=UPI0022BA4C6C|nr:MULTISPECIES: PAS domain-containing protein [unclassified Shewanella]MEC4727564.1 PAS domain-containing protein [Shewanella sp. D64]MEC4739815.1 PAS domain-containing protein [Shewanella sp. E94]WBJ95797.1 PAS domain-containing protein [Shewanella sp. MTB7]
MIKTAEQAYKTEFTSKDRELLQGYFHLAESMADLIGPHCEVVIHSLESFEQSVVKIVNGHHTGRKVGSPITDLGLKMLRLYEQTEEVTPKRYFSNNKDGAMLKSSTCILLGENGKPIGMFCVNMNLSYPFPEIIKTLMPDTSQHHSFDMTENFSSSAGDVVEQALRHAVSEVDADTSVNLKGRNKAITKILFDNGIFELKEATNIVANHLSITKHAVYKYIREFKS